MDPHGAGDHAFDPEPASEMGPDEPRTPVWLTAVGALLLALAGVWWLGAAQDAPAPGGAPSASPSRSPAAAPAAAILASNTSSLSITELGRRLGAAERTVGMHFFNPPSAMPLIELVRGLHTEPRVIERCRELAAAFGKTAIVVNDSPGFA